MEDGDGRIRDLEARLGEAEAALGASEARYRALFDNAPDALVEVDGEGVIVETNETARRHLGHLARQLVGTRIETLFGPDSGSWFGRVARSIEGEHVLADGRTVLLRAVPYHGGRGVALVALRDVSERVALQRDLAEAQRQATAVQVAAAVAHEVNNPLTVLQLRLDLLDEELGGAGRGQLAALRQQLDRIEQTVAGLQVVACGVADATAIVPLDRWIAEAGRIARPWLPEGGMVVDVPESVAVRGDLPALAHALARLLRRACDDWVGPRVSAEVREQRVVVTVEGPGSGEAGRGLSIAEVVLRDHGGTLVTDTSAGTIRFEVALPFSGSSAAPAGPPRVLVVEDEPLLREVLVEWGRRAGYRVDVVDSAEAALERLGGGSYAALLTDERLPGMSGCALLARVGDEHPGLRGHAGLMTGGVADGRWPVLRKPFSRTRLVEMLSSLVG